MLQLIAMLRCFFNLGPRDGNMLSVPLAELSDSHGCVSRPPCPPWSSRGRRIGAKDERATVFDRRIEWIGELARRGLLVILFWKMWWEFCTCYPSLEAPKDILTK